VKLSRLRWAKSVAGMGEESS